MSQASSRSPTMRKATRWASRASSSKRSSNEASTAAGDARNGLTDQYQRPRSPPGCLRPGTCAASAGVEAGEGLAVDEAGRRPHGRQLRFDTGSKPGALGGLPLVLGPADVHGRLELAAVLQQGGHLGVGETGDVLDVIGLVRLEEQQRLRAVVGDSLLREEVG